MMTQLGPGIDVRSVFVAERKELLVLLSGLGAEQWSAPTVCPGWSVRDIAVHLVHDDLRRLSRTRDHVDDASPSDPTASLPETLNASNESWVGRNRFLSPGVVVDMLDHTARKLEAMWAAADLESPAEGVWWAGVAVAPVWLDVARDYSEDWTHQQQIRDAVQRPGVTDPEFLDPVLDTLLRALPQTYRHVPASRPVDVRIIVTDNDRTLTWTLRSGPDGWYLTREPAPSPTASITLPADTLWRLASGGLSRDRAETTATITGAADLAGPVLDIVSVVR